MKKRLYFFSLLILPLVLGGCGYQNSTPIVNNNSNNILEGNESKNINIDLINFSFNPKTITVKKGTIITWTNKDNVGHTVNSDNDSTFQFSSGNLNKGGKYTMIFNTVGTFNYHCSPHPNMTAQIIVTD